MTRPRVTGSEREPRTAPEVDSLIIRRVVAVAMFDLGDDGEEESTRSADDAEDAEPDGAARDGDAAGSSTTDGDHEPGAAEHSDGTDDDPNRGATDGSDADGGEGDTDADEWRAEVVDRLEQVETEAAERIKELEAQVAANVEQIDDLESGLEDHRRRSEKEREEIREYAVEEFADEMVQVKDSLETAIRVEDIDESAAERLELLNREFEQALSKSNVQRIDDPSEEFDALRHKIISKEPSPAHDSNEIVEIADPGYAIGDRVLRPARVVLAI